MGSARSTAAETVAQIPPNHTPVKQQGYLIAAMPEMQCYCIILDGYVCTDERATHFMLRNEYFGGLHEIWTMKGIGC